MKLSAKIKSKYLDKLLSGEKTSELRQFEYLELTDEKGRKARFNIKNVEHRGYHDTFCFHSLKTFDETYPDVKWDKTLPIFEIELKEAKK